MRPQPMRRRDDCLATAVAALLDLDELDLPSTGGTWPEAWDELRYELARRGWRLAWLEWSGPKGATLDSVLDATNFDDRVERELLWMIGVTHADFVSRDGGEQEAHVLVCQGPEIVFDPGGDTVLRPPLDELVVTGFFSLMPIDPARFVLVDLVDARMLVT